jgi:hypothetical protein
MVGTGGQHQASCVIFDRPRNHERMLRIAACLEQKLCILRRLQALTRGV